MNQQGALLVLPERRPVPLFVAEDAPGRGRVALRVLAALLIVPLLFFLGSLDLTLPSGRAWPGSAPPPSMATPGLVAPPALKAATTPDKILPVAPDAAIIVNAKRGFDGTIETVAPFRFALGGADADRAVGCLAAAGFYEAGDDAVGQRAVMQVVLNRVRHPSYPKTVCGVVFEGSERRTGCQFTFTCDGALVRIPSPAAWDRARALAAMALAGGTDPDVGAATHYHADYVVPRWAPRLDKLAQIGAHIFYRFPGAWGRKAVFLSAGDRHEPAIRKLARLVPAHGEGVPLDSIAGEPVLLGDDALNAIVGADAAQLAQSSIRPAPPAAAPDTAVMMLADPSGPAGRWAVQALSSCQGKADCQVIGWASDAQLQANRNRPAASRERPTFLFVRDKASGMDVAMWDCNVAPRPNPAQCLPVDDAQVKRLMRQR